MKSRIVTMDCGLLQIEWQRTGDRWQHVIGAMLGDNLCPLLNSVEGTADDHWPLSPVLQELHVEPRGDDRVAFLTGMAGGNHWSASVRCQPQLNRATFELACRCKQSPGWLGSLYQTPEWLEVRHSPQSVALSVPHQATRFIARSDDLIGSAPQLEKHQPPPGDWPWTASFLNRVKGFRRTIVFAPQLPPDEKNRTLRWEYTLEGFRG